MIDLVQEMTNGRRMTIGMVHTLPLPGSYDDRFSMQEIVDRAVADAQVLERTGFDALVVENQNDGPLTDDAMDAQRIAALTYVCSRVMDSVSIPVGIDACGDQIAAISIASVVGASFVRLSISCTSWKKSPSSSMSSVKFRMTITYTAFHFPALICSRMGKEAW